MEKIYKFESFNNNKPKDFLLKEHKFWGKSLEEFLNWLEEKTSGRNLAFIDTETTGLKSDPYKVQLTQVSSIMTTYNFSENSFSEIDFFDKKIKLDQYTLDKKREDDRITKVLSFNRYGQTGTLYEREDIVLSEFKEFIDKYDPLFVIQNAEFDMYYLNTRSDVKFKNEVIDTKQLAQLFWIPLIQKLSEENSKYKDLLDFIGKSSRDSGYISSSLSKIGPALGINMSGYHDALTDCRLTIKMFQKMIQDIKNNKEVDIIKYQSERIKILKKR